MQRVDKQTDTQGNLSLISLPKIDEIYAYLHGAKYSPNLICEVVIAKLPWIRNLRPKLLM